MAAGAESADAYWCNRRTADRALSSRAESIAVAAKLFAEGGRDSLAESNVLGGSGRRGEARVERAGR